LALSSYYIWVCQAVKSDAPIRSAIREALEDLFHYIGIVLKRLKIEPEVTITQEITQTLVKTMMQLMSVFSIATEEVNEALLLLSESILTGMLPFLTWLFSEKHGKKLLEGNDVERILQRLDRLTSEEARKTVTPTLEIIYGLVNNLTLVMQGAEPLLVSLRAWY